MARNIPYPSDLGDVVAGAVYKEYSERGRATKTSIFNKLSRDKRLKRALDITNEQIRSAIDDCFTIHAPYILLPKYRKKSITLKAKWCKCSTATRKRFANWIFKDDNTCQCGVRKHHWHCPKCGGISQVG